MSTITVSLAWLGGLYAMFVAKHFIADFLLQTSWMALGKGRTAQWLAPLAVHAGIHAGLTLVIMLALKPALWWLAVVDFIIHSVVDRAKALVTDGLRLTQKDSGWWWLLGLDQALHELTHLGFVLALLAV